MMQLLWFTFIIVLLYMLYLLSKRKSEGMLRMKFMHNERLSDQWRCCLCCHVRTGTIFLGIWHLILHVLALSVIAVILLHPEVLDRVQEDEEGQKLDPMLPTPLSNQVGEPVRQIVGNDFELSFTSGDDRSKASTGRLLRTDNYVFGDVLGKRRLNCQDLNVGIAVTLSTLVITLLMLYGAIKGRPSYLMPFFCLQVFDFCISSLSMIGYFSYLPDVHQLIAANPNLPFQRELLSMDPQLVGLAVLVAFVLLMVIKAYFIGVVWNCYKFLSLGRRSAQGCIHYIEANGQGDLPDYETAVNDPAYAKKEALLMPPPYSAVVSLPPEVETSTKEEEKVVTPAPIEPQQNTTQ